MAVSLGGLYFDIGARTGNLKKGIAQAQNSLNQLDKTGKKLSKSLDSIFDKAAYEISKSSGKSFNSVRKNLLELSMHYKQQANSMSSAIEKAFNSMGKSSDKETARMLKNAQKLANAYDIEKQKLKGLGFTDDQMKTYKGTTLPTKFNLHNLGIPTDPEYNFKFKRRLHNLGIPTENLYKESMQAYQMKSMHENYHASMQDAINKTGDKSKTSLFTEIFGNTQIGRNISNTSNRLIELSKVAGESGGKLGSVGSTLGKVGAAASKAGPYIAAIVIALKAAIKVAEPFIKIYSKILEGVVKTTGSIALKIGQSLVNGLISPIKKGFEKLINPFGRSFGNRLGTIIGAGAFAGLSYKLKNLSKDIINSGADFEQMTQGIQILFADTRTSVENNTEAINAASDRMRENAMMAYRTTGMNANDYMSQASGFATRVISELEGDTDKAADVINTAMQDMSDNWHLLGGDFESIRVAYQGLLRGNYRTFDNLKLGYGQTKGEVQRLLKDAERLSGETYDIDKLSDIMMAIHEIQKATGMTGTTAREALTTWAGAINMLKNAWMNFKATVGQGLIYLLRPVLQIIAKISDALVSVGLRFMKWAQKITGIKDLVVGKKNDEDYSSAATGIGGVNDALDGVGSTADKAKKAVKDLKRELMGFDEINKLTGEKGTDTGSGTSGSGSGTGVDLDDLTDQSWMNRMIESAGEDVETIYEKYLKEAWERADFTGIGEIVARKLAEALSNIDWEHIQEVCGRIGSSVATFFNGVFATNAFWKELGDTLGEAINSLIEIAYKFVINFEWGRFGYALAEGLNAAIRKIDTSKLGVTISERIKGMLDTAATFISNVDFITITNKLYDLLFNIDFPSIKEKAGALGKAVADAVNDVFSNKGGFENEGLWTRAGKSFGETINSIINFANQAVTNFDWKQIGESISSFLYNTFKKLDGKKLGETIYTTLHGVFTTLKTVLEDDELWKEIKKDLGDALDEIDFAQLIEDAFKVTSDLTKRLWDIGKTIADSIIKGFIDHWLSNNSIFQFIKDQLEGENGTWSWDPENGIEYREANAPNSYMDLLTGANKNIEISKKLTVEVFGKEDQSYTDIDKKYNNLNNKDVTATGKGKQADTLGQLLGNWIKLGDKTSTVIAKGLETSVFKTTANNYNNIKNKDAIITAKGLETSIFKTTSKNYNNVKNKTSTVTAKGKELSDFKTAKKDYGLMKAKTVTISLSASAIVDKTSRTILNSLNNAFNLGLPRYAQGGYVQRNTPQLAIVGDNKREGEIIAPESKLAAMAQMAANNSGNAETNALLRQLISLVASMNLNVELDGEAIKNNTVRRINNHTKSTGQLELLI